jgi:hypothetical protein
MLQYTTQQTYAPKVAKNSSKNEKSI